MTQWVNLPHDYDQQEFSNIQTAANQIKDDSAVLIVIGIGGSYLGTKMALDFLRGEFYNQDTTRTTPEILFAGNSISGAYIKKIMNQIGDRDFSINVISKSGTTTEPAIAFRIFKQILIDKYGALAAANRIYVTTDAQNGSLRKEATNN